MKVAILGKLPSKFKAPFNDDSWQIWGCNVHEDMNSISRYNLWFDIHSFIVDYPNIPEHKLIRRNMYPLEQAIKLVGGEYFNNSIPYMIAYAILEGATEIALYGVGLRSPEEDRTHQLQNVRELLFFAKGRGIKVYSEEGNVLQEWELYK